MDCRLQMPLVPVESLGFGRCHAKCDLNPWLAARERDLARGTMNRITSVAMIQVK